VLKHSPNQDGYPTIRLSLDGKAKTFNSHWIIARTFHGEPPCDVAGDFQIHHEDTDKMNCAAWNLSYETRYDNLMEEQARYYKTGYWRGR
jgi:hypothetical protein